MKAIQVDEVRILTLSGESTFVDMIVKVGYLEAYSGNILITSTEKEEKYSYCLSNTTGDIIVNGEKLAQEQEINKTVEEAESHK